MRKEDVERKAKKLMQHINEKAVKHDVVIEQYRADIHRMLAELQGSLMDRALFARGLAQRLANNSNDDERTKQLKANDLYRRFLCTVIEGSPDTAISEIKRLY